MIVASAKSAQVDFGTTGLSSAVPLILVTGWFAIARSSVTQGDTFHASPEIAQASVDPGGLAHSGDCKVALLRKCHVLDSSTPSFLMYSRLA